MSDDLNIQASISAILDIVKDIKKKQEDVILPSSRNGLVLVHHDQQENEIKNLRAQLKGMEILLQQNAVLEQEVERLGKELDDVTLGVQKKGFLYKWRDKEISFASKWCLRYFVLQGNMLSYYADDKEHRPRRTFDLSKCFVRDEGAKKGVFHVFSIYLGPYDTEDIDDGSLLLRLSTENSADSSMWIDMFEQACAMKDLNNFSGADELLTPGSPSPTSKEETPSSTFVMDNDEDWGNSSVIEVDMQQMESEALNPAMIKRVKSSNLILRKSMSRQTLARRILSSRAPKDFTRSGHRLSQLVEEHSMVGQRYSHAAATAASAPSMETKGKSTTIPRTFPAYKPMHVENTFSPLSSDVRPGQYSFRGFFNLGLIILVLSHFDLILNNMANYGLQISVSFLFSSENCAASPMMGPFGSAKGNLLVAISWMLSISCSFLIEKLACSRIISNRVALILSCLSGTANLVLPCWWVWSSDYAHPVTSITYLFQSVVIWLKLISYSHANKDLRLQHMRAKKFDSASASTSNDNLSIAINRDSDNKLLSENSSNLQSIFSEVKDLQPPFLTYPQNLTPSNLMYFMIAPTLCYQLNYPRSADIRVKYVLSLVLRMVLVAALMLFSVEQYIKPTLETSVVPMQHMDVLSIIERLLKLSIPNTYVWLWGFYLYFHLWLNFLAEITRFGDRQFYKDWWNARTIDRYWRTWNLPVHHWITRHLYYPLLRKGIPKGVAVLLSFLFSAVFHELIISLPFRHISFHAFFGMLAQAPLIFLTKQLDHRFDNAFMGNALFWCLFCVVGQPMGIIFYYYDIWKLNSLAI